MKKSINPVRTRESRIKLRSRMGGPLCSLLILAGSICFTACSKEATPGNNSEEPAAVAMPESGDVVINYSGLNPQTVLELQQARAATARYRDIKNALKDGYVDVNIITENMGYHYMKPAIVDNTFELTKPEILIYNKNHEGEMELIAIEYAVPISLSPNSAPEGFTGNHDVWTYHTGYGLWLLHTWVWAYNPEGVFNPTNPLVHVH